MVRCWLPWLLLVVLAGCRSLPIPAGPTEDPPPPTVAAATATAKDGPCIEHAIVDQSLQTMSDHLAYADPANDSIDERMRVSGEFDQLSAAAKVLRTATAATRPDVAAKMGQAVGGFDKANLAILTGDASAASSALGRAMDALDALGTLTAADYCR